MSQTTHRFYIVYCLYFLFLKSEYNKKWNHITYVPDYIASGLPVVAQCKENSKESSARFLTRSRKGAHLDLRQGHASVVPLESASLIEALFLK
jgi:hypothetical protein